MNPSLSSLHSYLVSASLPTQLLFQQCCSVLWDISPLFIRYLLVWPMSEKIFFVGKFCPLPPPPPKVMLPRRHSPKSIISWYRIRCVTVKIQNGKTFVPYHHFTMVHFSFPCFAYFRWEKYNFSGNKCTICPIFTLSRQQLNSIKNGGTSCKALEGTKYYSGV